MLNCFLDTLHFTDPGFAWGPSLSKWLQKFEIFQKIFECHNRVVGMEVEGELSVLILHCILTHSDKFYFKHRCQYVNFPNHGNCVNEEDYFLIESLAVLCVHGSMFQAWEIEKWICRLQIGAILKRHSSIQNAFWFCLLCGPHKQCENCKCKNTKFFGNGEKNFVFKRKQIRVDMTQDIRVDMLYARCYKSITKLFLCFDNMM